MTNTDIQMSIAEITLLEKKRNKSIQPISYHSQSVESRVCVWLFAEDSRGGQQQAWKCDQRRGSSRVHTALTALAIRRNQHVPLFHWRLVGQKEHQSRFGQWPWYLEFWSDMRWTLNIGQIFFKNPTIFAFQQQAICRGSQASGENSWKMLSLLIFLPLSSGHLLMQGFFLLCWCKVGLLPPASDDLDLQEELILTSSMAATDTRWSYCLIWLAYFQYISVGFTLWWSCNWNDSLLWPVGNER